MKSNSWVRRGTHLLGKNHHLRLCLRLVTPLEPGAIAAPRSWLRALGRRRPVEVAPPATPPQHSPSSSHSSPPPNTPPRPTFPPPLTLLLASHTLLPHCLLPFPFPSLSGVGTVLRAPQGRRGGQGPQRAGKGGQGWGCSPRPDFG